MLGMQKWSDPWGSLANLFSELLFRSVRDVLNKTQWAPEKGPWSPQLPAHTRTNMHMTA